MVGSRKKFSAFYRALPIKGKAGAYTPERPPRRASQPPTSPVAQPISNPPTCAALAMEPRPSAVTSPDRQTSNHTSINTTTPGGRR